MTHDTRESWLIAVVQKLRSLFTDKGFEIPPIRISCSWPSRMIRKRIGECWSSKASKDGSRQMFISPVLDDGLEVAAVVVHELLHACLPHEVAHKGPFRKGMKALGLEGKPTATVAGEELKRRLNDLCGDLGQYPHSALFLTDPAAKKQGTRMLKLECPVCGCVIRTTMKWIDEYETWTCPCGSEMVLEVKP
jgi:hypothetical protein